MMFVCVLMSKIYASRFLVLRTLLICIHSLLLVLHIQHCHDVQASDPERSSKPCRHLLLEGECLRSDCAFSHDFSLTTCRFWLYGRCMYSRDECAFRHDLDVPIQGTIRNIPEVHNVTIMHAGGWLIRI